MKKYERLSQRSSVELAAIAAFVCGICIHLYALVNNLYNCDDIAQQPKGYGTGITSGRWLLTLLGDFFDYWGGNYNLPLINGVLFLILLSISAALLVDVLGIQRKSSSMLIGALFTAFPTVTATMFFRYTAVYYGIGILCAVLAAWILRKGKIGFWLSALFTAFSLGIYQAYVPITIGVFVLLLIRMALEGKGSIQDILRKGVYYCAALAAGLLAYFLLLKVCLIVYNTNLSDYQGVGDMGKLSLPELPRLIKEAIYSVCMLPVKDYCGLSGMRGVKLVYFLIYGLSAVLILYFLATRVKNWKITIITGVLCFAFALAVNFIVVMCPESWIYTLMVFAFVLIPCLPLMLLECFPACEEQLYFQKIMKKSCIVVSLLLILCYGYEANINYTTLYFANRQVENYCSALVVQIRMTEGFTPDKEWAFIGKIEDPMLHSYWEYETRYGGNEFTQVLLRRYSLFYWIQCFVGYTPEFATEDKIAELCNNQIVQEMPCWPSEGSIKVIGDSVVVKFEDLAK